MRDKKLRPHWLDDRSGYFSRFFLFGTYIGYAPYTKRDQRNPVRRRVTR